MTPKRAPSLIAALGVLPIALALMLYGGVTPNGRAALGPLLALCILGLVLRAPRAPLPPWPLAIPSLGLAALFALQLLPLPEAIVAALSPLSAEHRTLAADALQGAATLSAVNPIGQRLLPFFTLALAFPWALYHALGRPRDRGGLAAGLVALSALGALLVGVQLAMGGGSIYPFLGDALQGKGPNAFGFFINPNHGGLLSAIGAILAGALSLEVAASAKGSSTRSKGSSTRSKGSSTRSKGSSTRVSASEGSQTQASASKATRSGRRRSRSSRSSKGWLPPGRALAWGAISLLLGLTTLASGSQGALFALFGGGGIALFAGGRRRGGGRVETALIATLVGGVGLVTATGLGRLLHIIGAATGAEAGAIERRLQIWEGAWGLLKLSPVQGSGLGSYPFIGPLTQGFRASFRADYIHNDPLELLVEAGAIGAILALLGLVSVGRALARGSWLSTPQPSLTCGALGALGAIALHSLIDFPLQIPALALIAGSLLALVLASLAPPISEPGSIKLPLALAIALVALGLLGAGHRWQALKAEGTLRAALAEPPPPIDLPQRSPDPTLAQLPFELLSALSPSLLDSLGDSSRQRAREDIDNAGGHLLRALALHQAGVALVPSAGYLHRSEGLDRLYLGDNAGAEAALLKGSAVAPGVTASWWALARFYRLTGDDTAAAQAYKEAILVGDAQRIQGILGEVRSFMDPGPLVGDDDGLGLLTLGMWYRRRGERRAAKETFLKALAVTPGEPRVLEPLIQLELGRGEATAARVHLKALKAAGPPSEVLYRLEGDVLVAEGDVPHALAYHRKALSSGQRTGDALRVMKDLIALERWAEARDHGRDWLSLPREGTPHQRSELESLLASLPAADTTPGETP